MSALISKDAVAGDIVTEQAVEQFQTPIAKFFGKRAAGTEITFPRFDRLNRTHPLEAYLAFSQAKASGEHKSLAAKGWVLFDEDNGGVAILFHGDVLGQKELSLEEILRVATFMHLKESASLTGYVTRKLLAGGIVDLENRLKPEDNEHSAEAILDLIERNIHTGATASKPVERLTTLLDKKPELAQGILDRLRKSESNPLFVWCLLRLLTEYDVAGLDTYVTKAIADRPVSEKTLGSLVALRRLKLSKTMLRPAHEAVFTLLQSSGDSNSVGEGSIEEKVLSEALTTAMTLGCEDDLWTVARYAGLEWSFKIRVRAMSALQLLIAKTAESSKCDRFTHETWTHLGNVIRSLFESYNISSTSRALSYKAMELYIARLGPEAADIFDLIPNIPHLRERVIRSIFATESFLKQSGKEGWLKDHSSFERLKARF